jgi:pyruvate, water dikinase
MTQENMIVWLNTIGMNDIGRVGGKNASLGEMIQELSSAGIKVPGGFATTAQAYQSFLQHNKLIEKIQQAMNQVNVEDVTALAKTGQQIRQWIIDAPFEPTFEEAIRNAWQQMESQWKKAVTTKNAEELAVAVRSSATAEDLPDASFAGQQETYLNVRGIDHVLLAVKHVYASLFNDRAISYRAHHGFQHDQVAISAGIQQMVRSDCGASGVMFSIDTESGFKDVVFITSSFGLGEMVVQGAVNPDEFYVYKKGLAENRQAILKRRRGNKLVKMIYADGDRHAIGASVQTVPVPESDQNRFSLSDEDIQSLARQAVIIEKHYGRPMDMEWVKDGVDEQIYIVQARPETVKSQSNKHQMERYILSSRGKVKAEGRSIGQRIGKGVAKVIQNTEQMMRVKEGDVLVADMTDPDWEPVMKRAAAIVTNRGGRTCHAAIIARELGVPAVVGTGDGTEQIKDGDPITVSCAEGETGYVYEGLIDYTVKRTDVDSMPKIPVKIMLNVGNPERAFDFQYTPNEGVGLARLEFIISNTIGIHPKALLNFASLPKDLQDQLSKLISGYKSPVDFYVDKLTEGIATIAAAFDPKPVIVRLSDFKSNEYANLHGGQLYEPHEENPMLGFRGASRFIADSFRDCFELECRALKKVRNEMGLTNVQVMVPFVRTVEEGKQVVELLAANGLKRGEKQLKVIMMCEIPSNVLLADEFLQHFDGFSIGSNDLTQLTLGLDRDSAVIAHLFDERNSAVTLLLKNAIQACKKAKKYIGICGQGPSDHPDLAKWLLKEGIDSLSLSPDTAIETWLFLAK